jgi:uncharacterized membrane protein
MSCGVSLLVAVLYYALSPPRVPTHFGLDGTPDRWGNPLHMLILHSGLTCVLTAVMLAMPALVRITPSYLVNLPNREYWLSDDHRAEAMTKIAAWSEVFGTGFNLFLIGVLGLAFHAAQRSSFQMSSGLFKLLSGAFLLFTIASLVWLVVVFRLPKGAKHSR